ncbi:PP2C family protein-serine/threonine phosphatase [uncultured Methanobrevibacter sp.]|uniref:PP2C family protein-serine/threonine phosphatase n=1 Tax=uncultured Methanobrevibacter sp. TaxID=253161 RepID=UPI002619527A|nr:PP2C family protein-serine/threonine phosphatase [uncultured Methanobrevibacter sp.]
MDVRIVENKMELFKSRKFIVLFSIVLTAILFGLSRIFPQLGDVHIILLPVLSLILGPFAILGFALMEFIYLMISHPESILLNLLIVFIFFISNFTIWKLWYSFMNKNGLESPNFPGLYNLIKLFIIFSLYSIMIFIFFDFFSEEVINYEFKFDFISTIFSFFIVIISTYIINYFEIPMYIPRIQFKQFLPKKIYPIFLILFFTIGLLQTFFLDFNYGILMLVITVFLIIYLLKPYDGDIFKIKHNTVPNVFSKVNISIVLIILIISSISVIMDYILGLGYSESYLNIARTTLFLFIIISIPLVFYLYYLEKNVTEPLNKLSEVITEGITTIEDHSKHGERLEKIKVNNEIRVLIDSLRDMEYDVVKHVQNLRKVTSEKERYETELKLASDIQNSMVPKDFEEFHDEFSENRDKFELWGIMKAARQVGGDFYDYFQIDEDNIGFVIGDVSGKGISAALIMVKAMTLIQDYTKQYNDLSKAFYKTNNDLYEENVDDHFVTCWLGKINMKSNELSFVNAGHNSPLIKLNNNDFEYVNIKSELVLAAMKDMDYKTHVIPFKKGDTIFLYTDGVTEANEGYKEFYGQERLKNIINKHKNDNVNDIIDAIEEDIKEFCNYEEQFDDTTMFIIRAK